MKNYRVIIGVAVVAVMCTGIGFLPGGGDDEKQVSLRRVDGAGAAGAVAAPVDPEGRVMSVKEFQTWLAKRKYYTGPIDGKISPDWRNSLTQIAWDRAYNDQCGVEDMKAALAARTGVSDDR